MKWMDLPQLDIPYYTFENLENSGLVVNAFTTRHYRKNGEPDDFLQLLLRPDSNPREVTDCKQLLLKQFAVRPGNLVPSAQKHTINIHLVTDEDLGYEDMCSHLNQVDGLITNKPGVLLQTFGADCPSVYLLDPVNKDIGLCHSGRKGTQGQIAAVMLQAMEKEFGTSPAHVLAAISPGICRDCYEVGDDVAEDFARDYLGFSQDADAKTVLNSPDIRPYLNKKGGRYYIDLYEAIRNSLIRCGVPSDQIESSPLCTRCRKDIFYSFRGEGRISNENCALFMLKAHEPYGSISG